MKIFYFQFEEKRCFSNFHFFARCDSKKKAVSPACSTNVDFIKQKLGFGDKNEYE